MTPHKRPRPSAMRMDPVRPICRRLGFSPMLISVDTCPSYSCAPRASAARSCSAANAARSSSQVGNS